MIESALFGEDLARWEHLCGVAQLRSSSTAGAHTRSSRVGFLTETKKAVQQPQSRFFFCVSVCLDDATSYTCTNGISNPQ